MDFSQRNKINSQFSQINNHTALSFSQQQRQNQNFLPQVSQSFPNSVNSKYGQQISGNSQFQNQTSSFYSSGGMKPQPQMMQTAGDSLNRQFVSNMVPVYNTPAYSAVMAPSNSYCEEPVNQPEMKFLPQQPMQQPAQEEFSDDENVDVEYFQCLPTTQYAPNQQRSQIKSVMNSLRQFSKSNQKLVRFNSKSGSSHGSNGHNKTFCCQHEGDEHVVETEHQKTYRSHTKIQNIPNGFRIVTEILKEDNEGAETEESAVNRQTQTSDDWLNKKIEVSIQESEEEEEN